MRSVVAFLTRWRGQLLIALVVALATAGVTLVVRSGSDGAGVSTAVGVGLLVVIGLLVVGIAAGAGAMFAGVDPDARGIAARLTADSQSQRLLGRWLQRTRWARNVGGAAGIAWWFFGTSARGDLLLFAVVGIALGSMVSQLHHVQPITGSRTAALKQRSVTHYLPAGSIRQLAGVGIAAVAVGGLGIAIDEGRAAVSWALAALIVIGATHLVQRSVAARSRPMLSDDLRHADDLARELAIGHGLARPAVYCSLAMLAHGIGRLGPTLGGTASAFSLLAWLTALVLWWRNRGLGLNHLADQPLEPTASTS